MLIIACGQPIRLCTHEYILDNFSYPLAKMFCLEIKYWKNSLHDFFTFCLSILCWLYIEQINYAYNKNFKHNESKTRQIKPKCGSVYKQRWVVDNRKPFVFPFYNFLVPSCFNAVCTRTNQTWVLIGRSIQPCLKSEEKIQPWHQCRLIFWRTSEFVKK